MFERNLSFFRRFNKAFLTFYCPSHTCGSDHFAFSNATFLSKNVTCADVDVSALCVCRLSIDCIYANYHYDSSSFSPVSVFMDV